MATLETVTTAAVDLAIVMIAFCLLCAVWIFLTETVKGYVLQKTPKAAT